MHNKQTINEAAPETLENCPRWQDVRPQRLRLARLLSKACDGLDDQLDNQTGLALTIPEYLKLLQMALEFEDEAEDSAPTNLTVTWVYRDPITEN